MYIMSTDEFVDRSKWVRQTDFTSDWHKAITDAHNKAMTDVINGELFPAAESLKLLNDLAELKNNLVDLTEAETVMYLNEKHELCGCTIDYLVWALSQADPINYYKDYSSENPFIKPEEE